MSEKRKHDRHKIDLPASFEVGDLEENLAVATTLNVSSQGLCFLTKERLSVGQRLLVKVKLPNREKVFLHVRVAWVKTQDIMVSEEYNVGVEILDAQDPDSQRFVKFCEWSKVGPSVDKPWIANSFFW